MPVNYLRHFRIGTEHCQKPCLCLGSLLFNCLISKTANAACCCCREPRQLTLQLNWGRRGRTSGLLLTIPLLISIVLSLNNYVSLLHFVWITSLKVSMWWSNPSNWQCEQALHRSHQVKLSHCGRPQGNQTKGKTGTQADSENAMWRASERQRLPRTTTSSSVGLVLLPASEKTSYCYHD